MSNWRKKASLVLGTLVGMLVVAYYWLFRRPLARTRVTLRLTSLHAPVEVIRDRWGVPHIYAQNNHDLMFAQGFVHAQDRLWQMDYNRRLASGRLSEIFGEIALPVDRWIRILGLRRAAERDAELLEPYILRSMKAFADGVNARIAQGRLPVEFTLLRYKPDPWTVIDSLVWGKMMAWTLSGNWESELLRAKLIVKLGPELASELEPDYPSHWPSIIPPGVDYSTFGYTALERSKIARPYTGPGPQNGLGSNSWVLAGTRTATGKPMLANDMHLFLSVPAIWYENHLVGGDLDVTGVSFPGVPNVVAGHNRNVAWGFTNGLADVQDLYIEHLRRMEDGGVQYEFKGEWYDATVIREQINIHGKDSVEEEVVITQHGPIINALAGDFAGEQPLALRWTTLKPERMFLALYKMNRARDCKEFREALRHWSSPVQNVVYADINGNIAYTFAGRIPIRARGEGLVPVPGWSGEYEWTGTIPYEELPYLYNPPQGYITTANNRVAGENYAYFIGREFIIGDRAQRIAELIESRQQIDLRYIQRMHFDQVSLSAQVFARHIDDLDVRGDPGLVEAVSLLRGWDGELSPVSAAAAVYEVFTLCLMNLILEGRLGDLTARYIGKGPTPVLAELSIFSQRAREFLQYILDQPESRWYDLGNGETRDEVLRIALRKTVDYLKAELGPRPESWAWGKLHRLTFAHPLPIGKPLDRLFKRGPYSVGGDSTTIWLTSPSNPDLGTESLVGPPFRFIADLGDLRNSISMLAPGQSGQLGSPHYADQIKAWFSGDYHPMLFSRPDVDRHAAATLHFLPADT